MRVAVVAAVVGLVLAAGAARAADDKGKVNLTVKVDGKEMTVDAGGYKLEKDTVTLTGKDGNKNDKGRICLLNKSSFVINDEVEDKVMVMKRQKVK